MATNSPVSSIQAAASSGQKGKQNGTFTISCDILDDLASRFIINVPVQERENLIRICFQMELAHWFYLDFYCSEHKQKCGIKQFAQQMFKHVPFLQPHWPHVDNVLENWKQYKVTVPTCGAILLSEDLKHVLLVQSFWAKSSWGFPKGKINENEEPMKCAIREVYEETGYDIGKLIVPTEYIELVINYQFTRLYLVSGVPLTTVFEPKTRNEIKCCEWFPVDSLPVSKHDSVVKDNQNLTGNSFFMILPFVKRLKKWLETYQKGKPTNKGKGATNVQASNSPVFGRESAGKQKIFFENNLVAAGGSGSKNANNNVHQQQAQKQRQRHKSMGELEPQQQQQQQSGGTRGKNNTATPNANQQPVILTQQFYKSSPNYAAQQLQQPAREDSNRSQRAASVTNESYLDFSLGVGDGSSAVKKKPNKSKQDLQCVPGLVPLALVTGAMMERPGKSQTKRKLFDNLPASEEQPANISGSDRLPVEGDSLDDYNEVQAWVGFRLDYSKFL
ncbi:m7GpppN-mRNA hydrolase [Anopheles nili]|uniref:m7GpppN-mRNA hydrolase n=1 Tax=Anopheles nili TaxID=185578 RepID=UPI00237C4183|nr:m7GpppN-mRNA hydrolase [Anopheles nili]